jgi:hypothetical protein
MSMPNYVAEGRIRAVCAENGVRPEAFEDIITRFRAGKTSEAELPALLKEASETPGHHFFAAANNDQLYVEAFGPNRNLTKQSAVVKLIGVDEARKVAASFNTTLGGKPGVIPTNIKSAAPVDADHNQAPSNPWSAHPANLDQHGRYSAKAIGQQARLVRVMGEAKASQIAFAADGAKLGDVRPRQRRVA